MASNDDLTVITVVEHDNGLMDLMLQSIVKFTDPMPKFIICDNTGGKNKERINQVFEKHSKLKQPDFTIIENTPTMSGGSNRHGEGLNKIFPLVETSRTAIVESDCVVLAKNWDKINFPKYKMLAAKKGELAGQPFYHVCFTVFSTGLLKHDSNMDFRPGQEGNRSNRSYKAHEDVGWQLRKKIRTDQVQLLDFVDCKSGKGKFFNNEFQSDEFWLDGRPICAHFGRGSNLSGKTVRNNFKSHKEQLENWKKIAQEILSK